MSLTMSIRKAAWSVLIMLIFSGISLGHTLDAINILAFCGNDCWTKDTNNIFPDQIRPETEVFDGTVVRCMQTCFAAQTRKAAAEGNLPLAQILKIKVSSYCGYICYNNNKHSKKALDYCYAGCLGTILQPRIKNSAPKTGQMSAPTFTPPRPELQPGISGQHIRTQ